MKNMLISRRNLEAVLTDQSGSRTTLEGVFFREKDSVSTNSHVLVIVPYPKDDLEDFPRIEGIGDEDVEFESFILSREGIDKVLKNLPKGKQVTLPILYNAVVDLAATKNDPKHAVIGMTDLNSPVVIRAKKIEGPYPDVNQVIPSDAEVKYSIRIGLAALDNLLHVLKKSVDNPSHISVRLDMTGGETQIKFRCEDVTGLIMPWRRQKDETYPQDSILRDDVVRAVLTALPANDADPITMGRWITRIEDEHPTWLVKDVLKTCEELAQGTKIHGVTCRYVERSTDEASRDLYRFSTDGQVFVNEIRDRKQLVDALPKGVFAFLLNDLSYCVDCVRERILSGEIGETEIKELEAIEFTDDACHQCNKDLKVGENDGEDEEQKDE